MNTFFRFNIIPFNGFSKFSLIFNIFVYPHLFNLDSLHFLKPSFYWYNTISFEASNNLGLLLCFNFCILFLNYFYSSSSFLLNYINHIPILFNFLLKINKLRNRRIIWMYNTINLTYKSTQTIMMFWRPYPFMCISHIW